jgi:hypothetical protein
MAPLAEVVAEIPPGLILAGGGCGGAREGKGAHDAALLLLDGSIEIGVLDIVCRVKLLAQVVRQARHGALLQHGGIVAHGVHALHLGGFRHSQALDEGDGAGEEDDAGDNAPDGIQMAYLAVVADACAESGQDDNRDDGAAPLPLVRYHKGEQR